MILTINRSKWLRSEGSHLSFLLRPWDNKMCCLGFYLKELGFPESKLMGKRQPYDLVPADKIPEWLLDLDPTSDVGGLIRFNDHKPPNPQYPGCEFQEKMIKKYFAKHDVEVVFED